MDSNLADVNILDGEGDLTDDVRQYRVVEW